MSDFRFIHCADLHIDSPLRGLQAYEGAPVDRLRRATRDAFQNLITLAIDEAVAFVLIAGDLFDGRWPDMSTGLWTARQFRRLAEKNIRVFMIRGNHDAMNEVGQRMQWPDTVHELSCDSPETVVLDDFNTAIHGQGFANQKVPDDIAAGYPDARTGLINIGLLHTSLTGDPQHDPYAPTSEDTLKLKGYDYWALGHIHLRRTINEDPWIGYCGNSQGRHIHERGAKGCLLVTVQDNRILPPQFRSTDVLRWFEADITVTERNDVDELYDQVRERLNELRSDAEGRFCAVRIVVTGACAAHATLVTRSGQEEVIAGIRNIAAEFDDVWVEKIKLRTSAPVDVERLRRGSDLMGDLLRGFDDVIDGTDAEVLEFAEALGTLRTKAGHDLQQADINLDDPERVREWLRQAESILVSMLTEAE